jgi:Ca-activated chloride channel family protein
MPRLVGAVILAAATSLAAQPSFKSAVELVTVPLTVTNDQRDQLITSGLTAADFRIFEDGIPQPVTLFSQDRRPTSLCIVVDASGSMAVGQRLELGITALRHAVLGLNGEDEVAIVRFAGAVTTLMPWTRAPGRERLTWKLDRGAGSVANSSITDAVKVALGVIDQASNPRRALLLISDGYENTSKTSLSRVVTTRAQSEALVYAFEMAGPVERAPAGGMMLTNILPSLVGDSGGVLLTIRSPANAAAAALTLLNELKYQYTLAYTPSKPLDGTYRRIKVEITVEGLRVRHRGGYLALPQSERP